MRRFAQMFSYFSFSLHFSVCVFVMNLNGPKSNRKAESFRICGYQDGLKGRLYDAMLKLNRSLCFVDDSVIKALIYANRAEIYFKLKLFDKCLNNIELSREENCTKEALEVVAKLEEDCLKEIYDNTQKSENPWEFFKLSHPENEKLPYVANCLEVKNDKKFGRLISAKQDLAVGDIIAIEKPFLKILKTDPEDNEYPETNVYIYCANCLSDNLMELIPCDSCNSTMFCSKKCQKEAEKGFHQYECSILSTLKETEGWRMTFRCFFDALSLCEGSFGELEELLRKSDELSPTVFNFDFSGSDAKENAKLQLMCMLALTHSVDIETKDFKHIFQQNSRLVDMWAKHGDFIQKFLERMMQIEILNFHGIKGRALNQTKPYRTCVGDGGYTFCSLINHSCCPNVMRIIVDTRMVVIVERPIKKGEQLFDCYIG